MQDQNHRPARLWHTVGWSFIIFQLGAQLSIHFSIAPGSSLWYLPIPLGMLLVQWWGLPVVPVLYLNALLSAGLWGLPTWYLWPLYALPETVVVMLSWFFFHKLKRGQCWLPDLRQLLQFLLFGIVLPVTIGDFLAKTQLLLLGDLSADQFWPVALSGWVADLFGCLAITVPMLALLTPVMEAHGLLFTAQSATIFPGREQTPSRQQYHAALMMGVGLLIVSLVWSVEQVWFLYGLSMVWCALRCGVRLTLLMNTWITCLVLLFPTVSGWRIGASWIFNSALLNIHLSLICLIAAGMIVAYAISELHQSECRYRQLSTLMSDYLFKLDVQPDRSVKMTWMSDNYTTITGRTEPEVRTPEAWATIIHPDDRKQVMRALQHAMTTMAPVEVECRSFLKNGTQRWVHIVARAEWDDAQQHPIAIFGAVRDITDRKLAEIAARESEAQFRLIFNAANDGMLLADQAEKRFSLANSAMCQMLDYTQDELLHLSVLDIHPADAWRDVLGHFERMAHGEERIARDMLVRRKDGRQFYADITASLISLHGKLYLLGIFRDTTDRQRTEQALRQAQKDWEEIFQAIGQPTLILDPEYTILAANRATVEVTGKTEDELKQRKCFEIFHLSSGHPGACPMHNLIESHHMETLEMEIEALSAIFLVSCTPVRDEHGNLEKIIHIATDITARRQAEEQVRRLNSELEERVRQRTAELETANRELKDFAYSVSHDLKAPLRAISRLTQWLVDDYAAAFDERGKEMVHTLVGRVQRMDDLIEGILEYSRIGRVHGELVPIDLSRLVYEVIESLAPPGHIQITVAKSLPTITADKTRIVQVFQNLIGNAIKFLDKPYGTIHIDYARERTHYRFSVRDNGPGIDAKYHTQIFQIFQTLQPRDQLESTGVGLAVVKKIVEFYGGRVWVESTVGQGSTFFFTLPR